MNNYGLTGAKPSIDTSEVSSVREMIFNRAREKSSSLAAEKGESFTESVKDDVMSSARNSITGERIKPFGNLTQQHVKPVESQPEPVQIQDVPKLKHNIQSVDPAKFTDSMRDETMAAARNQYGRRGNLNETLKFLNTQAAIRMVNKTHSKIV